MTDSPLRDLAPFLEVARLLPLEQRIAVVRAVMTLLEDVTPPDIGLTSPDDTVIDGWQAAAAGPLAEMKR